MVDRLSVGLSGRCELCYCRSVTWTKQQRLIAKPPSSSVAGKMSSPKDQLVDIGVDLAQHVSLLLKGLMTAGAYAVYKKYFAEDLNSEAARTVRQQLPRLARESGDGRVHHESVEILIEEVD